MDTSTETSSRCAMNTRFNSFYTEGLHPFITAMNDILVECARRSSRPSFMTWLARGAQHKWDEDYSRLHDVATDVIAQRRSNPTAKKDLLNALINGRDPKTGEGLSDESIRNNMVTFLIAGKAMCYSAYSFQAKNGKVTKPPQVCFHSFSCISCFIPTNTISFSKKSILS